MVELELVDHRTERQGKGSGEVGEQLGKHTYSQLDMKRDEL